MKCDQEQFKFVSYHVIYSWLVYYQTFNNTFALLCEKFYSLIIYIIKTVVTSFLSCNILCRIFTYLNVHGVIRLLHT